MNDIIKDLLIITLSSLNLTCYDNSNMTGFYASIVSLTLWIVILILDVKNKATK